MTCEDKRSVRKADVESAKVMLLKKTTLVTIHLKKPSREVTMFFRFTPNQEEFVLATRFIVTEIGYEDYVNYMFVKAAEEIGLPDKGHLRNGLIKNPNNDRISKVTVYHDEDFLFEREPE